MVTAISGEIFTLGKFWIGGLNNYFLQLFPSTTLRRGQLSPTAPELFSLDVEEFPSPLFVYRNSLFRLSSNLVRESGIRLQSEGDPAASLADAHHTTVFWDPLCRHTGFKPKYGFLYQRTRQWRSGYA